MKDVGQFERDGFIILREFLPSPACNRLTGELTRLLAQQQSAFPARRGGLRNVLRLSPAAFAFAHSGSVAALMSRLLGAPAFPVRAILFDKTETANWGVPWHQDVMIAVAKEIKTPGFGPWSTKDGVRHVLPPAAVLSAMGTIRLHLDDCHAGNGALHVLPGSHAAGILGNEAILAWRHERASAICEVPRGGVLVMRPLLLHASLPAEIPSHRRVLHVEYAANDLPNGLEWSERL